ncbi:MAG: metallophosphoesterase family protein [Muribaculaceae bacterium]|nr:metallophosphoesterase family protein [Muribaculaceae bacterium]
MKLYRLISFATFFIIANHTFAQSSTPYTIITNPGEDAATTIRLNWHTNEHSGESRCFYTTIDDIDWSNAKSQKSHQELCTIFDSIYSKTADGKDFYESARFMRNTIEIDSLTPNVKYKYHIDGDSTIHYFKTAPTDNNWTAAIISDFHAYTPLPKRATSAMQMLSTLEQQNGEFDLILHVGDITAWGGSYSFWRDLYSNEPFRKYAWAGVNGNHDNMSRGYTLQSNKFFRNVNNNPLNGYQDELGVCYHFTYGNTLFIMLNNESMKTDEGLQNAQQWVRKVIAKNPARFTIIMEHYQWFYGESGKASQYDRWKNLFDKCGVDLAIAANNHIYARTNAIFNGEETDGSKGTVYIQTPSADNERGQALQEWSGNHPLIKYIWNEGANTVGALLLTATDENLTITLHDRDGNTIDTTLVTRK